MNMNICVYRFFLVLEAGEVHENRIDLKFMLINSSRVPSRARESGIATIIKWATPYTSI